MRKKLGITCNIAKKGFSGLRSSSPASSAVYFDSDVLLNPFQAISPPLAAILKATLLATFREQKIFPIFVSMQNHLKDELHNVLSGKSKVRFGNLIQAIACYLNDGEKTSPAIEVKKHFKEQETKRLELYISQHNLWMDTIDFSQYVSEGAEQKVYLKDSEHVLKLNDSIYYTSWKDYLYNLLLHNYFFSDTAYNLLGFTKDGKTLYAVVQQNYVSITAVTDLKQVKDFLTKNGFVNNRNNDYFNPELGIILEDLHDENVLTKEDMLYFIDTVFYLTPEFWK